MEKEEQGWGKINVWFWLREKYNRKGEGNQFYVKKLVKLTASTNMCFYQHIRPGDMEETNQPSPLQTLGALWNGKKWVANTWDIKGQQQRNIRREARERDRMYPCKMIWMGVGLPNLKVVFIYSNVHVCVYACAHVCVNLQQFYSIDTPLSD